MEENKNPELNISSHLPDDSSIKPPTCRICYDIEKDNNLLIHPCHCSGSVKYVHEECLKTWLLSTNEDLSNRKCELCHTQFKMEYHITSYFSIREICDESIGTCMFIPILLSILGLIVVIIYFLSIKYSNSNTNKDDKVYSLALMAGCSFAGGIILIILIYMVKSTFMKVKMEDWRIKNQEFSGEVEVKLDGDQVFLTAENEIPPGNLIAVSKSVKLKGKKMKAPKVMPLSLVPVYEGDKMIGYKSEQWENRMTSCLVLSSSGGFNTSKNNPSDYDKQNATL